jgi:signal transduction histidine kinase
MKIVSRSNVLPPAPLSLALVSSPPTMRTDRCKSPLLFGTMHQRVLQERASTREVTMRQLEFPVNKNLRWEIGYTEAQVGRSPLEESLLALLLERSRAVLELQGTLARERAARVQAEARDADKAMFLGVLGHDLLSPLQAILTTAQLMTMRRELEPSDQAALTRVTSSAVRMQRMIEQLREMTRSRQTLGLRISRNAECDLAPLVTKVIHEIRAISPTCSIDFDENAACRARVDGDRFEQVASNLIGNAVAHGGTAEPVAVLLEAYEDRISFSVHNYGHTIGPDQLPHLFEPFTQCQSRESRCHSAGLGLGLYIADCIVRAHGGEIRVTSSPEFGTRFCAILPVH